MNSRYRITAKSDSGESQSAVRFSREAAIREARRQLFHKSKPTVVRVERYPVDKRKGNVV